MLIEQFILLKKY